MGLESIGIVTGCKTTAQFVALFHRFCDAKSFFIPTTDTRPVGSTLAFSLRLADGTSMLRGMCLVSAVYETPENAYKRAGVQLEIQKLAPDSVDVFEQLLAQKPVASDGVVEEVHRIDTNQHVPRDKAIDLILRSGVARPVVDDTRTVEMPPLQYLTETRVPGASDILPANPLCDVDEAALDAMLSCSVTEAVVEHADAMPLADARAQMKTLLGVAPLTAAIVQAAPVQPVVDQPTRPVPAMSFRLRAVSVAMQPLVRTLRPSTTATMRPLAMTPHERLWFLAASAAVLLLAVLVIGSAMLSL